MKKNKIQDAIFEARRFIKAAEELQERMNRPNEGMDWQGFKESGACRRSSLDLTRALARMRQP